MELALWEMVVDLSLPWEEGLVLCGLIWSPASLTSIPIYHPGLSGVCLSPQHDVPCRCKQIS